MSDASNNNGSFSHAFLPGLILGLVLGAVAGAFLPDFMGGSNIPTPTGQVDPSQQPGARDGEAPMTGDEIQDIIDDAENAAGDVTEDASQTAEDPAEDTPETPSSDG